MDLETFDPNPGPSFTTELGKTFMLGAVSTAGACAGLFVIGFVAGLFKERGKKQEPKEVALTK